MSAHPTDGRRQCWTHRLGKSLFLSFLFSVLSFHKFSRTSQGTNPLFFPLATLMKPLCSSSLPTQICKCVDTAALSSCSWWESKLEMIKQLLKHTHLSLFQGNLPLFLTANKGSVTSEHPIACPYLMRKGCREKTYSIFNHTLELLVRYTRTNILTHKNSNILLIKAIPFDIKTNFDHTKLFCSTHAP